MAKNKEVKGEAENTSPINNEDVLVEVLALRQINTTLYGNIREGKTGKIGLELAEQLEKIGEVKVL